MRTAAVILISALVLAISACQSPRRPSPDLETWQPLKFGEKRGKTLTVDCADNAASGAVLRMLAASADTTLVFSDSHSPRLRGYLRASRIEGSWPHCLKQILADPLFRASKVYRSRSSSRVLLIQFPVK